MVGATNTGAFIAQIEFALIPWKVEQAMMSFLQLNPCCFPQHLASLINISQQISS